MSCAHIEEVEELVLGNLEGAAAGRVRAHLDACAQCREAQAMFAEEQELFTRRARFESEEPVRAPAARAEVARLVRLDVEGAFLDAQRDEIEREERDPRPLFARVIPAFAAVAACVAAFVGAGELSHRYETPVAREPAVLSSDVRARADVDEDGLSCAFPASRSDETATHGAHVATLSSSDDELACSSSNDRNSCEDLPMSRLRVTSSYATP